MSLPVRTGTRTDGMGVEEGNDIRSVHLTDYQGTRYSTTRHRDADTGSRKPVKPGRRRLRRGSWGVRKDGVCSGGVESVAEALWESLG